MATTAVAQHELTDLDGVATIEDRLADRVHRVLLLSAPHHVHRDVALGEHRVDHEPVAGEDRLLVAQVEHHEVVVHLGDAGDLLAEQLVL